MIRQTIQRAGDTKWALLGLLFGLPLPVVILIWFSRADERFAPDMTLSYRRPTGLLFRVSGSDCVSRRRQSAGGGSPSVTTPTDLRPWLYSRAGTRAVRPLHPIDGCLPLA